MLHVFGVAADQCTPSEDERVVFHEENSLLQRSSQRSSKKNWSVRLGTPAPTPAPQLLQSLPQASLPVLMGAEKAPALQQTSRRELNGIDPVPPAGTNGFLDHVRAVLNALNCMPQDRENTAQLVAFVLFSIAVQVILGALIAHTYLDVIRVQQGVDESKRGTDLSRWSSGLVLDFWCDSKIYCLACFCPCVRWADSLHTLGIMSFWAAFWLSIACVVLTELTEGLFWWMLLVGLVYFRHRLRRKFKMEACGSWTQIADFLRYCFCLPCTLAQDARHIEEACRAEHPAVLRGTLLQFES